MLISAQLIALSSLDDEAELDADVPQLVRHDGLLVQASPDGQMIIAA